MNEKIANSRKEIVDSLIREMQEGKLHWLRSWKNLPRPYNPVSKVVYQAGNRIRLQDAAEKKGYQDPRWCTYLQAKNSGWHIKAGENGILCEKWIWDKVVEKENPDTGEKEKVRILLEKPFANYFYVWNGEQIEGIPAYPKRKAPAPDENLKLAGRIINSSVCSVYHDGNDRAYYMPVTDSIHLPKLENFFSYEGYLATCIHEMGHSTRHSNRLNRNLTGEFGGKDYAKEELIAELCSVFVQSDFQLELPENPYQNNAAYLQSWIGVLEEDYHVLFSVAVAAEKASAFLVEQYAKYYNLDISLDPETGKKIFVAKHDVEKKDYQKEFFRSEIEKEF